MRIAICGGGGLGHTCAGILSNCDGVKVDLLTNHPDKWNRLFTVHMPDGTRLTGKLDRISRRPADIIPDADWVFLCLPAFLMEETLLGIKPHLQNDTVVGAVAGNTGFFLFCHKHLPAGSKLFSFQRVPYISRVVDYGRKANLLGFRDKLILATENIHPQEAFRTQVQTLFHEETELAGSFYEVTLSNSNPILHTGRLYTMWNNWDGTPFSRCSLFYKEWTLEASALDLAMDREFFALLENRGVSTRHIATLLEHYDSADAEGMTAKLRSIVSLSTILSPMKQVPGGWMPDFSSRFFTEDFPFGLRTISEMAKEDRIPCPHIEKVYQWGMSKTLPLNP